MRNVQLMILAMVGTVATAAPAQQQIDTRVPNSNARQDPYSPMTLHYTQQFSLLPSERLFAYQRSGMTPSELIANEAALGPLSLRGGTEYIDPQSRLQQILRLPPPVLYNPAYIAPLPVNVNAPPAPPPLPSNETEPAAPPAASAGVRGGPFNLSISGQLSPVVNEESTVTYRIPTRSPRTQPSLSGSVSRHSDAAPATQPAGNR